MSIGVFDHKDRPPTTPEILTAVGPALKSWNELGRWMRESLSAQSDLKYLYGEKYGWALRFQIRSKLLSALYPTEKGFTAQVILNRAALERASHLKLGKNAKQAIDRAHLYAEGKWLLIPVESERDAEDVKRLLTLKIEDRTKQNPKSLQVSATNR